MVEKKLVVIKDRNKVLFCFGGDQYALAVRDGDALDAVGSLLVALGERMLSDERLALLREVQAIQASLPPARDGVLSEKDRLSRKEAAEYLGVKASTLSVWATTGRYALPYVKVGRRVVYLRRDLDKFLDDRRKTHTGE